MSIIPQEQCITLCIVLLKLILQLVFCLKLLACPTLLFCAPLHFSPNIHITVTKKKAQRSMGRSQFTHYETKTKKRKRVKEMKCTINNRRQG